jgi:dTDP-4-amino-4,6-dideoxy-D-galactose acyltransferase
VREPPDDPGELLPWDSDFFGCRIGRVRGSSLTPELVTRIDRWAARERVECLYLLAGLADPDTPPLAEASGFRLVDVRITLERSDDDAGIMVPATSPRTADGLPASAPTGALAIRPADAADLPALRRLAATSHRDSRFYYDPHFARERCDALYAAWIERSWRDRQGIVLVAEIPGPAGTPAASSSAGTPAGAIPAGTPGSLPWEGPSPGGGAPPGAGLAGYVTASAAAGGGGQIGLLAVAEAAQGQGAGGRLVSAALAWLDDRGAGPVRVVTQGRNLRAQRLYQRYGLRSQAVELWYHRWSGSPRRGGAGLAELTGGHPGEEPQP